MKGKLWQVWTQGYAATGEREPATYHGEAQAENFVEACEIILGDNLDRESDGSLRIRNGRPSVWACGCFDNEADARKSFG